MITTDKGHCWITFKNGYTISIANGFGSYSENHFDKELLCLPEFASIDSKDCEVAVIRDGKFCTSKFIGCDDVQGYLSTDELADLIYKVKNYDGSGSNE